MGREMLLGFLQIFSRAMGCFFGCFRARGDHGSRPRLASTLVPPRPTDAVMSQNHLAALLTSDENEGSPCKGKGARESLQPENNDIGLKDEAKFLKACGTLAETPAGLQKGYKNSEDSPTHAGDSDPSKFHSRLPNIPINKPHLSEQPEHLKASVELGEHLRMVSSSSDDAPSSCVSDENNMRGINTIPSDGRNNFAESRNKSVCFDCESSMPLTSLSSSSSGIMSEKPQETRPLDDHIVSRPSTYPTPLNLHDEMQTPGTVFPANLENLGNGKNARIRSKYMHSVLNPIENDSQWKVLLEEESNSNQLSGQGGEFLEQPEKTTTKSGVEGKNSEMKELKVEASLSDWLKPLAPTQGGKSQYFQDIPSRKPPLGRTPGDRPILGTVATYWNEDEPSQVSPKWWDGNGIPNSTNKYKEDQKVSWHATPFEERLEKALSDESFVPQRSHSRPPLVFDDAEQECDTAMSQMKPSAQSKSVVSF